MNSDNKPPAGMRLEEQLNYIDGGTPTPMTDFTKSFNKNLN